MHLTLDDTQISILHGFNVSPAKPSSRSNAVQQQEIRSILKKFICRLLKSINKILQNHFIFSFKPNYIFSNYTPTTKYRVTNRFLVRCIYTRCSSLFCLSFKGFTIQMAFVHVLISKN